MDQLLNTLQPSDIKSIKQAWSSTSSSPTIRVGTLCSGTDAPIFALEALLSKLNQNHDNSSSSSMTMEHVFSCENVKFKRDFIAKTSNPPLIFNDLIELANNSDGRGLCHDGSTHALPNNEELHFLIAGTECKDFSSLSSSRKGINDRNGKSASTFWATHKLAKQLQPCIILLENVSQCPASQMANAFIDIGYTPVHSKVCTSNYYLPQSRCRSYFIFLNNKKTRFREGLTCDDWIVKMERLKRKENDEIVSWTRYLGIDNDDSDAMEKKMMMMQRPSKKKGGGGPRGKPLAESLDSKWLAEITAIETKEGLTPYNAKEGGGARPYTDITKDVEAIASLPDRAKMRLDVQYKRAIKVGIDPMKSHLIWNPAQQLRYTHSGISFGSNNENDDDGSGDGNDRSGGSNNNTKATPRLITPCVTPKHEWIISSRMGPLTGVEALALQGICNNQYHHQNVLSKEVLSQFKCEQLRDLAGNAVSTTVVAAVFISTFLTTELIGIERGGDEDDDGRDNNGLSSTAAGNVRTKKRARRG